MTEEIIIDCAFYKDGVCASPINKTCEYCKNIDVSKCYHKQLKRLEQENKELKAYKDVNEDFKKAWDELNKKYTEVLKLAKENADSNEYCLQELEQENKKLKKDVQLFKCLDTFGESECHCACRCLGNEFCEDADKKINSYRSALEEIKEIAKDIIENDVYENSDAKAERILTKINEVLK